MGMSTGIDFKLRWMDAGFASGITNAAARMEGLNKKFSKVSQTGQAFGFMTEMLAPNLKGVSDAAAGVKRTFSAFAGVSLAVAGIGAAMGKFAHSSAEAIDRVGDLAARYKVSSQSIQVFGSMVQEAGGSMDDAASSMKFLNKSMHAAIYGDKAAAAAFAGVGLSVADLKKMKPDEVMAKMADAFKASDDKGLNKDLEKAALLTKVMGKNGTAMMDVLNQGGDKIRERYAQMTKDGSIYTQQQLKDANDFTNSWQRTSETLGGIKNVIGLELMKSLMPVVEGFRDWLVVNREMISANFKSFLTALPPIFEAIANVAWVAGKALSVLLAPLKMIGQLFGAEIPIYLAAAAGFAVIAYKLGGLAIALGKLGMMAFAFSPLLAVIGLLAASAYLVYKNWAGIVGGLKTIWDQITALFTGKDTLLSVPFKLALGPLGLLVDGMVKLAGLYESYKSQAQPEQASHGRGGANNRGGLFGKSEIGGTLNIKIDADNRVKVGSVTKKGSLDYSVDSGGYGVAA